MLPPSGQSAHAHGHGDRPSEKQDEAAAALAGGTATASGALTTSTACQPACFFRCCMACAASPVSLRACVDQIEVLNDERRLPSDLRLPQSNRTISPVTWCAAPHLPWPAPLWTHVGERRTCGVDIRAAVGHSPKLLDDIRKLTTLVQITQDHRRGLDGLQHYRSLRRNLGRSGKHSITNLTSHVNFTLASSPLQHSPSPSRIIAHRGDSALLAADATTPPTPPPCATYIDLRGSSFAPHTCSQFDADLARCSSARVGRTRCMLSNATSNATATATATATTASQATSGAVSCRRSFQHRCSPFGTVAAATQSQHSPRRGQEDAVATAPLTTPALASPAVALLAPADPLAPAPLLLDPLTAGRVPALAAYHNASAAGVVLVVLPCSFGDSRFEFKGDSRRHRPSHHHPSIANPPPVAVGASAEAAASITATPPSVGPRCLQEYLRRAGEAASVLRVDLPTAIYSGGRLGGNAPVGSPLRIEPHWWERVNLDVGYSAAIGWVLGPQTRRLAAFPHDAWVSKWPTLSREPCPANRSSASYARARLEFFHHHHQQPRGGGGGGRGGRLPRDRLSRPLEWKRFVYGDSPPRTRSIPRIASRVTPRDVHTLQRARWANCYHAEVERAFADQRAYASLLAEQVEQAEQSMPQATESGQWRPSDGSSRSDGSSFRFEAVGGEAEVGSGFCFTFNQVHVSWGPSDIRGVFYVNDTLSPMLLEGGVTAWDDERGGKTSIGRVEVEAGRHSTSPSSSHRHSSSLHSLVRTRRLADQTKLLPPSARGAAWKRLSATGKAELTRQLRETALVQAAAAFANARQAKALVEKELGGGVDLPVMQYRLSPECFDTAAVRSRVARGGGLL